MEVFYKKNKGNAGLDGVQFQVNLLTVFLLNALYNHKDWRISTENEDAGKFDDAVIELSDGSAILLQAKHKTSKRISKDQLLSDNSRNADFSLPKYFLSYQEIKSRFNIRNVIICTNADVDKKKLNDILTVQRACPGSILHFEGENCCFIKFNENILPNLRANSQSYYEKNMVDKGLDEDVISDENLKDFLEKLQFFTNYPSKNELNKVIDHLLSHFTDSKLFKGASFLEIYTKVEDWFKNGCGQYLTESYANAMFCEIKSDKFCKTLKRYNLLLSHNSFSFTEDKRVYHVSSEGEGYLIPVLKIYHALRQNNTLYVDLKDEIEESMVEAFQMAKYEFLVMVCTKVSKQDVVTVARDKLNDILDKFEFKQIILVGRKEFLQQFGLNYDILDVDGSLSFRDLEEQSRERLIEKKSVAFQGEALSLKELLNSTQALADFAKIGNLDILEKLVKGEMVKVGIKPQGLDEDTERYYIERSIERETNEIDDKAKPYNKRKEVVTEENVTNVEDKIVLISDSAGMGKSTILTKWAAEVKPRHSHLWIIRIELNNCTRIMRDALRKKKRAIGIMELLNSCETTKLANQLEEFVFSMNGKVMLMLDAFDEISPDYTGLILSLLRQCREASNIYKIIVTTRPHLNEELEDSLQLRPFVLRPFTKGNQIQFLTNFWVHNLQLGEIDKEKCQRYSVTLIDKISFWINQEDSFTAIPLQVRMIADIFQENPRWSGSSDWEGCKEFLGAHQSEPRLPERMKITQLYDMFVEKKLEIYIDKVNPTGTAMSHSLDSPFGQYFANHQSLAIGMLLRGITTHEDLFSRYQYDSDMEAVMFKIGIVQKVNGNINFIHRTFAEYFLAKSILEISDLQRQSFSRDITFQQFFLDDVLYDPQYAVVRAFLESVLEDVVDSLPSDVFDKYKSLQLTSSWRHISYLLRHVAGEGCVAILRLLLKCIGFTIVKDKEVCIAEMEETMEGEACNTLTYLKRVVEQGGVNIKLEKGDTPLLLAADRGSLDTVRFLVEHGANVNIKNQNNVTPLYAAAYRGHLSIVKYLVEYGIEDVDTVTITGNTAMSSAAQAGHLEVVRYLVKQGADINVGNEEGFTALHGAATEGKLDVIKFLLDNGMDVNVVNNHGANALHSSAPNGHFDTVAFLIGCGLDVNARCSDGTTPTYAAVHGGYLDITRFVIDAGGDASVRNNKGETILHLAALRGYLDIVEFLTEHGMDTDTGDNQGFTVLHSAAASGHLPVVEYLLRCGMDVDIENRCRSTPLYLAAQNGHLDVVRFLVSRGANINAANDHGCAVLHRAATNGHVDIVACLVEHGADVRVTDLEGCTPLVLAIRNGHLDTVRYFVERGVPLGTSDEKGFGVLHVAAHCGCLDIVEYLVGRGLDADVPNEKGITPIHCAAQGGHLDTVRFFARTSDLNVKTVLGSTPLHLAGENGHTDIIKFLMGEGVSINNTNNDGFTVLHAACQFGHSDTVRYLIENGAEVDAKSNFGTTPINLAAVAGQLDVVRVLATYGADVNVRCDSGYTALHGAASRGHLDIVRFLVDSGVNAEEQTNDGISPLSLATRGGHLDLVKFFLEGGASLGAEPSFTLLHCAANIGHLEIAKLLVSSGANVVARDSKGCPAMFYATSRGHLDLVEFLVESGTDIDSADADGFSALHIASQAGHLHIARFLLEKGMLVNARTNSGYTALHSAASKGRVSVVEFLVHQNIHLNVKDKNGMTALLFAVQNGFLDTVKLLIDSGEDVDAADGDGFSALHIAAQNGHFDVAQLLVDRGAELNSKNKDGFVVLHSASKNGRVDIIRLFLENGLEVNAGSGDDITPLHLAADEGHLEAVKYLVSAGANVELRNKDGETAWDWARAKNRTDVVEFLTVKMEEEQTQAVSMVEQRGDSL